MANQSKDTKSETAAEAEKREYEDKRKHRRIHTRIEIPYWKYVKFKREGDISIGFVKNMSKGGFFIETETVYARGHEVGFEFYLPNSAKPVSGMAKVAWLRQADEDSGDPTQTGGMGLEFDRFEGESEAILEEFIEKELAKTQT